MFELKFPSQSRSQLLSQQAMSVLALVYDNIVTLATPAEESDPGMCSSKVNSSQDGQQILSAYIWTTKPALPV